MKLIVCTTLGILIALLASCSVYNKNSQISNTIPAEWKSNNSIKILALSTSPVRNGNSETLLNSFLDGVRTNKMTEIKKINLTDLNIRYWNLASDKTEDVINEPLPAVYKYLKTADIIVIATPIYMESLPAQLKALIDRSAPLFWQMMYEKKKFREVSSKGYFICVCDEEGNDAKIEFDNAKQIIKSFFENIGSTYSGEILCENVAVKGDVNKRKKVIEAAFMLGKQSVSIAQENKLKQ